MTIPFEPVLVSIGSLTVRWFGLLVLVGLAVAVWAGLRELDRQGLPRGAALEALAWAIPVGVLMGRLVHVLGWWDYYFTHSADIWQLRVDGLSSWGALVGGGAVAWARLRRDPTRRRRLLDAVVPAVALGIVIGRLGAFVDGHGQGVPSALPWATQYSSPLAATPDFGVPRHPVQLYDALVALLLWLALSRIPRHAPAGTRLACFCLIYGGARVALGGVRGDPAFLFGLQIEQLLALAVVAFGAIVGGRLLAALPRGRAVSRATREAVRREDTLPA